MVGPQRAVAEVRRGPRPREIPNGEREAVRIWLLGDFRVSVGSWSIREEGWRLKKAASLLKLVALAPGHRLHPRDREMRSPPSGVGLQQMHGAARRGDPAATAFPRRYEHHGFLKENLRRTRELF